MSNYYAPQNQQGGYAPGGPQNLQFYPSSYSPAPHGSQSTYGFVPSSASQFGASPSAGATSGTGVSGRMGEQAGLRTGWLAAFSAEGYDGEPPLMEELGVNFGHIQAKTLAVLNPFRPINQHLMDDSDLAGPILFFLLFGTFLLFSGKVHFGYIYGLALLGSTSLHLIISLMSPVPDPAEQAQPAHQQQGYGPGGTSSGGVGGGGHFSSTLTFARSASVLGYCLLPLVATSLVGVLVPMNTVFGHLVNTSAILWCTYSASGMFCAVGRMRSMRALVAYPLALFYVGFGLMGIFSSRGVGSPLAGKS